MYSSIPALLNATTTGTTATTTTGNATLSGTNYNTITWTPVTAANGYGAASYRIFRTASGGSPSTTGAIKTISAANCTATLCTFNDTGYVGDGTSVPSTNTTEIAPPVGESPAVLFPGATNLNLVVKGFSQTGNSIVGVGVGPFFQGSTDLAAFITSASSDSSGNLTINYSPIPGGGLSFSGYSFTLYGTGTALDGTYGNGSASVSISPSTITITGAGATPSLSATSGVVHQPWSNLSYNGTQGAEFDNLSIVNHNRPGSTGSQTPGTIVVPSDQQYSAYLPGTYGVKDFRGGSMLFHNVMMGGCEYCFWGLQSDFDRFERVFFNSAHIGIYLAQQSAPNSTLSELDGYLERMLELDGVGQQGFLFADSHMIAGNAIYTPVGIVNREYDPTAGGGGGTPSISVAFSHGINYEYGGGGCVSAPKAFVSIDADTGSHVSTHDVVFEQPSLVNSNAGLPCHIPYFTESGSTVYIAYNQPTASGYLGQIAAWNANVTPSTPTVALNSLDSAAVAIPACVNLSSGACLQYNSVPYIVGGTTALNTSVSLNSLTVNSGGTLRLNDDGSSIGGVLGVFGTGTGTASIYQQNGGNPTNSRFFKFYNGSSQTTMTVGTFGIRMQNNSGTPLSVLQLSADTSDYFSSVAPGFIRFRSDLNGSYGRWMVDNNTNKVGLFTTQDANCSTTGPTGTPSSSTFLRGDCSWATPTSGSKDWHASSSIVYGSTATGQTGVPFNVINTSTLTNVTLTFSQAPAGCSTYPVFQLYTCSRTDCGTASGGTRTAVSGTSVATTSTGGNNYALSGLSVSLVPGTYVGWWATAAAGCSTNVGGGISNFDGTD